MTTCKFAMIVAVAVAVFSTELSAQSLLDQIRIENPPTPPSIPDVVETVKKAAEDVAKETKIAGENVEREVKKVTEPIGAEISKGVGNVQNNIGIALDAANDVGKKIEEAFCDMMTLGGSKDGSATCGVNAGVRTGTGGQIVGFDPKTGEEYAGRTISEVEEILVLQGSPLPQYEEFAADDINTIARFLPGDARLGSPAVPGGVVVPTVSGVIRGRDGQGGGGFLSSRDEGTRFHGGVDYVVTPGEQVRAPISGMVRFVDAVYTSKNQNLTGIEIRNATHRVKLFYVAVDPAVRQAVGIRQGDVIGVAQDLQKVYGASMTNHVHLQIEDNDGRRVDPTGKIVIKPRAKVK